MFNEILSLNLSKVRVFRMSNNDLISHLRNCRLNLGLFVKMVWIIFLISLSLSGLKGVSKFWDFGLRLCRLICLHNGVVAIPGYSTTYESPMSPNGVTISVLTSFR